MSLVRLLIWGTFLLMGFNIASPLKNYIESVGIFKTSRSVLASIPDIQSKSNIWDDLKKEFALNHEVHKPEVQKQIKWLKKHPEYIKKMTKESKPYIYHILTEIKKRNLPGELALIPMIESEFNPYSSSHVGAVGLWQIMPETAHDLGIIKNWWVDGRRNLTPSTNAALNYLEYLHNYFHGNWILAVAAYDTGEARVAKAIKRSHKRQFWGLSLPHETKKYIPKLLALSEVVQNPERYDIELDKIPVKPYFQEVNIKPQIPINKVAKLAEIPKKDLHRLNAGFKDWSKKPQQPYKLLIPTEHVGKFKQNLAQLKEKDIEKEPAKTTKLIQQYYIVKRGNSLREIADDHHITVKRLKKMNPHIHRRLLVGQKLKVHSQAV